MSFQCLFGKKKALKMPPKEKLTYVLPLLQVLRELSPKQQSIILGHLDDKSCATLCTTIRRVIQSKKLSDPEKRNLQRVLSSHKHCLRSLCNSKSVHSSSRRRNLQKLGGNPLLYILSTAIPLLLDIFKK